MTEQEELQKRYQQIAETERFIAEARKALDLSSWARENGIDLPSLIADARRRCSPADYAQAEQDALQALGDNPGASAAPSSTGARRNMRAMV
jgi:hypothetical protein